MHREPRYRSPRSGNRARERGKNPRFYSLNESSEGSKLPVAPAHRHRSELIRGQASSLYRTCSRRRTTTPGWFRAGRRPRPWPPAGSRGAPRPGRRRCLRRSGRHRPRSGAGRRPRLRAALPAGGSARRASCRAGRPTRAGDAARRCRPPRGRAARARHGARGEHARSLPAAGTPGPARQAPGRPPRRPCGGPRRARPRRRGCRAAARPDRAADWYGLSGSLALVLHLPAAAVEGGLPAGGLALLLGHHELLLGLARVADLGRAAVWVLAGGIEQVAILVGQLLGVGLELAHQGRAGLAVSRELAGRQEEAAGAVAQHIVVLHLLTGQLRHVDGIHLGRRHLSALEQLAGVLALAVGAAEVLAEAAGLELHLAAALVALDGRAIIALDAEAALLDLVAVAVRAVAADVQLAGLVDQVAVHGGAALGAALLGAQGVGLGLLPGVGGHRLLPRQQVHGRLAALLGRQVVARAAQEDPGGGGADLHLAPAAGAVDIGGHRLVGAHPLLALGLGQLLLELGVEGVEQRTPVPLTLGHLVEAILHARREGVVHQIREGLLEPLGDDIAELLGVEATVLQLDVAAILDGGDDRGVGGGAADAALLQLLDQARLGVAGRRLGEVLLGVQGGQGHGRALGQIRQGLILVLAGRLHHPGIAVELQHPPLGPELIALGLDGQGAGEVLRRRHLAGHELAPDQLVEAFGVALHAGQVRGTPSHLGGANGLVGLLSALLAGVAVGGLGQVARPELLADEVAHALHRVLREVGGVGTHIGDVARLVEALGQHHGLLHREAEPAAGGLLQGRGDKGRVWLGTGGLVFPGGDGQGSLAQRGDALQGLGLGGGPESLAVLAHQLETYRLAGVRD